MSRGRGFGRGRGGVRQGIGGPTYCKCPSCGYKVRHTRGVPCTSVTCPECGSKMVASE